MISFYLELVIHAPHLAEELDWPISDNRKKYDFECPT